MLPVGGADGVPGQLLPAIGAGWWMPVAVYLLATGAFWQGAILIAYGFLVIGLVDNIMRPMLVGKDTRCRTISC
jgi:predicted PurR-regulated permease PerM